MVSSAERHTAGLDLRLARAEGPPCGVEIPWPNSGPGLPGLKREAPSSDADGDDAAERPAELRARTTGAPRTARSRELRETGRRLTAARPSIVWSLALLFAFKSLVAVAVVAFPLSVHEPTRLLATAGVVSLAAACAIWLLGPRMPMIGFKLLAAVGALAASGLVAQAHTTGGMMVAAFSYPWIAIYGAHFFPRRVVNGLGVLITFGFAGGLLISGLPHATVYWFVVTATVWSICVVLGGLSESVRRQVGTDQLTGALNRTGFTTAALRERAIADRTGTPLTVAAIDLDDFKQVNDGAGHAVGDRLLATLASEWRTRLRPGDILARHGGDEFVVPFPSTSEPEARSALARLHTNDDPIGWSAGTSEWLRGEELATALARADTLLYEEKGAKRRFSIDEGHGTLHRFRAARAASAPGS
jgi:diguanylate cyclase (GGDEF)-like protein